MKNSSTIHLQIIPKATIIQNWVHHFMTNILIKIHVLLFSCSRVSVKFFFFKKKDKSMEYYLTFGHQCTLDTQYQFEFVIVYLPVEQHSVLCKKSSH